MHCADTLRASGFVAFVQFIAHFSHATLCLFARRAIELFPRLKPICWPSILCAQRTNKRYLFQEERHTIC